MKIALVSWDLPMPDWAAPELRAAGGELLCHRCRDGRDVAELAREAEVVWVFGGGEMVTADVLEELPACRIILRTGSGTDNIPVAEATRRGILVANTPEAPMHTVAEHALGLLLAVVRQIPVQDRLTKQGRWDRQRAWPSWSLGGRTLGLVGFGRIAQLLARKASGLELRMIASDPHVPAQMIRDADVEPVELDELLARADFISLHVPLSETTRRLIGERELKRMKKSAVLINTSRGRVVDEAALVRALAEGWIAGAGLDVLEEEPPRPDHPLFAMDNVVLTPHLGSFSDQFAHTFWRHSVDTLLAVLRTGQPVWVVNAVR